MKVSFIIPVYNAAKYLPRLIESLKAQKHSDWEALFTDDGSTDNSIDILNDAASKDARIRVFQIVHQGSSGARNKGLDNATGDIVGFIDADDFIHPQLIETALPYFEDAAVDSAVWDYATVDEGDDYEFQPVTEPLSSRVITDPFKWALSPWQPMAHDLWRSFYRRETIGTIRFYPRIKHQDLLFTYQVWGGVRKMIKIDAVLYAYVQSPNSVIRSKFSLEKMESNFIILRELHSYYDDKKDLQQYLCRKLFPRCIKNVLKLACKSGEDKPRHILLLRQYLYRGFCDGTIGFRGFSLAKRIMLLRYLFAAWIDRGGFDMSGRMKKLALCLHTRKTNFARLQAKPWQRTAETVEKPVSVIVPVYNGYDAILRLTRTLFAHTDLRHTIVFIDDASPDDRIKPLLEQFAADNPNVRLMSNECNLGFAATVNKAIEATENDFVLLNTDTEVPQDWIPRLFAPIWSDSATASVTPTTCESHLLGVPTPEIGTIQFVEKHGVEAIDKAISRVKPDLEKDVLVEGVGFCLAISRKAWVEVGPFAAEVFGRGYGEEADWCLRAHYGHRYENRFVSNLFVAHWHGGSFTKEETLELQKRNNRLLALRNPRFGNDGYLQALAKRGRKELWVLATKVCKENGLI